MTHRERFYATVTHQATDRAVFDLCGISQTFVDFQETKDDLAKLMNLTGDPHGDYNIDQRILLALNIDTRCVGGMPTPVSKHRREESGVLYDNFGLGWRDVGDRFEICHNPLKGCTKTEMEDYVFPDPKDIDNELIDKWAAKAEFLHTKTDYAVIAEHPVLGVFELGCWLFGFDDYLYRLIGEPEVVHTFSKRVIEYQKQMISIFNQSGYILSPAHAIQYDVPAQNLLAVYEAAREFYGGEVK
ncbi:MAG: uroporphyrinogen decarboxylase family protein [Oscillospiraceae bacterium]|jgi:uroporphyrinogen decarboxylase|nr:uroporphyrinogen decarboxylase family protein [Oscillospiraceae bacterium]